jgi:enamine deaminase RidA (YjgF/YER057c/UK114 family)
MSETSDWRLPIGHSHHLAASAGALSFVGGAGDFDAAGTIRNPDDLERQIDGAFDNLAEALDAEGCDANDVVRLKAYYTAAEDASDWPVIAALAKRLPDEPLPAISTMAVPLQPFTGQLVQLQAICQRGWRGLDDIRVATRPVPAAARELFGDRPLTGGLRAGEFIAVASRTAADGDDAISESGDGVAQSHAIMAIHEATLAELGASPQDAVKMEGYYFGTTREAWAPLAQARASHFHEPGPVATVVPCHRLAPEGAVTKIEVLAVRELWNGFDKYIPREDHWPKRVWDWPIPVPYRQAIRLRDTIWLGGQVPSEPGNNSGRRVLDGELLPQTRFTMSYIEDLLRPFGRRPADLKLMVCYFTSTGAQAETDAFCATLADCVGGALPPLTLVPQPHMHTPETMVEIWGVAEG